MEVNMTAFEERMAARELKEQEEEAKKLAEPPKPPTDPPVAKSADLENLAVTYTRSKASNVGYVKIADEKIWKTVRVGQYILLDLNFQGEVIGIELDSLVWA